MKPPTPTRALGDLLVLVGPACLLAAVVVPVNQLTQAGGTVEVTATGDGYLPTGGIPPGAHLELGDGPVRLVVSQLPAWLRLATETSTVLTLLSVGFGSLILWRLLRNVWAGETFQLSNAALLVWLAAVVALGNVAAAVGGSVAAAAVVRHVGLDEVAPVTTSLEIPLTPVIVAALLLVVADTVRTGTRMRADLEGLV